MGSKKLHRVVVLGAGFGGIRVARKLARYATSRHLSVTLVNRASTHAYTPAFYALAGTTSDSARHRHLERAAALPLRRLCKGLPITILEAEVAAIDTGTKKVALGDGRSVAYDTLVIALGSEPAYYGIPGLQEHAVTLKTLADADKVSRRASALMRGRDKPLRIVIGGGGATGCELAAMLAETVGTYQAGAHITLLEANTEVLPGFDDATRRYVRQQLNERQVTVRTGQSITGASEKAVSLGEEEVPFDLLVWTGGIQAPAILSTLPYVLERGRVATDAPLTCVPAEGKTRDLSVYALGDSSCFYYGGKMAPWTAQVALQQGDAVAANIIRAIDGKPLKPFKLKRQAVLLPLGTRGGAGIVWGIPVRGRIVQVLAWVAEFRHLAGMLPLWNALKLVSRRVI